MTRSKQIQCKKCGGTIPLPDGQAESIVQCTCGAKFRISNPTPAPNQESPEIRPKSNIRSNSKKPAVGVTFDESLRKHPEDFGTNVPSAYEPSGAPGNLGVLFLFAVLGMAASLAAGLLCGLLAFGITYVHSLLPVYIFIVPFFVLILVALTPGIAGAASGLFLSPGVVQAKCRNKGMANAFTLIAGSVGVVLLIIIADLILTDGLLDFIRLIVGGSFHFQWGANFQPINVPAWIIYGVIIISGLFGVLISGQIVVDKVASTPYCEDCEVYLDQNTLWSITPRNLELLVQALDKRDMSAARSVPPCPELDTRVDVTLWTCGCNGDQFVELFGHTVMRSKDGEQRKEPVRVYSAPLSVEEARQLIGET